MLPEDLVPYKTLRVPVYQDALVEDQIVEQGRKVLAILNLAANEGLAAVFRLGHIVRRVSISSKK